MLTTLCLAGLGLCLLVLIIMAVVAGRAPLAEENDERGFVYIDENEKETKYVAQH